MYLKTLKLVGFKSFADRTRLELRPGVTVVVGPNGSGKSNLVDAVSWVMGTQSAKSLRTPKMEDVVFAGTATRPSLNRAEVTLVFDNESRTLPLDLDEVSITRRLYRDGSSDYELNGVSCRLLDIQELLSDSGVGRHQHVIVGQGQIDSVLNSGPAEHRSVIEEAAGILKHRQRKERALRRLERTDADILRLQDIVGELTRQMRPLKRQANAAEQHAVLTANVRALHLYLGGEQLREFDARMATLTAERQELAQRIADGEAEVDELASALNILTAEAGEVGQALDRDTAAAARLETILERLRRAASVAHERRRAAMARRDGAEERKRDLESERDGLSVEVEAVRAAVAEAAVVAEREERRSRTLEDEARSLADQEGLSPEGALAVVRGELRALEGAQQRDGRELDQVQRRIGVVEAQIRDDGEEADSLNEEIRRLDEEATLAQTAYRKASEERQERQKHWEAMEAALSEARLAVASARARLEAVEAAAEGTADPEARAIVDGRSGHLGSLTSLLDIPDHLAAAVDAALSPWADASVFDSTTALHDAVAALKSDGRGGVPMVAPDGVVSTAREVAATLGLETLVDNLGPKANRKVADALLGDVILVEGWSAGRSVVAAHPEVRAVTPEGDLITVHGVRVAHPDGATPAMVEAAEVALERATTELARVQSLHTSAKRDFEHSRGRERETLEALEAIEARISGASEALGRVNRARSNLESELVRLQERKTALEEAASERDEALARLRRRVAALEGEEAERQRAWEEMEARRSALEAAREEARAAWNRAEADLRAARERLQLLERRQQAVEEALEAELTRPVSEADLERFELIASIARRAIDTLEGRLETLRIRQADLRERAGETGVQREAVRNRHEAARSRLEADRKRLGEIDLETTEIRVRREGVAEGLRRDADADEDTALAAPRPDIDGVGPDDDLTQVLAEMEARLRRMGPVNPLAAQEYAELEERHIFLTDQLADLESSRRELRHVVAALDEEIQGRFDAAFEEVARAYEEHFALLFPGGKGKLRLTDPSEPLTTGVEIHAQPLGKKVSQLSLLSGGERSLAALAFLFAVFRARPSPFYILDEVEAALDDANLRRFLRLIEAFRHDAQLVIVTHQQQTMEAANVLYGVTMEPGGSSSVVRKELEAAQAEARTEEASAQA
ncbi:MAG TPA: chromosome segregation protein SMC [Acidimicrobiia bacterium]|nr:chromosome segregation protein SMC [Acidimicrobiia bacterium]